MAVVFISTITTSLTLLSSEIRYTRHNAGALADTDPCNIDHVNTADEIRCDSLIRLWYKVDECEEEKK